MSKLKNIFSTICIIIGSVIGAGFASGREILLFFNGSNQIATFIICVLVFSIAFIVMLNNGKNANGLTIGAKLVGKYHFLVDYAVIFACFAVLSAMYAGGGYLLASAFNQPQYVAIYIICLGLATSMLLVKKLSGIKVMNIIAVPLVIFFLLYVCIKQGSIQPMYEFNANVAIRSLKYVALNAVTVFVVLCDIGKQLNKKEKIISSIISAVFVSALLVIVLMFVDKSLIAIGPMPIILLLGDSKFLVVVGNLLVLLAIVTTLLACAYPIINEVDRIIDDKIYSVLVVVVSAMTVAMFGFDRVVDYLYPLISYLGIGLLALSMIYQLRMRNKKVANEI